MCFVFFFSSRRRHTRSLCDWSSDVCSSDLKQRTANSESPTVKASFSRRVPDSEDHSRRECKLRFDLERPVLLTREGLGPDRKSRLRKLRWKSVRFHPSARKR